MIEKNEDNDIENDINSKTIDLIKNRLEKDDK